MRFLFPVEFFCSTENFYREKEKNKKKLWVETEKSLYQERHCKRVETRMSVRFFECTLTSRVSNKYVFFFSVHKYIYISILWAVVMSGSRGGGQESL